VLGLTSGSALFLGMKDTLCGSNANINTATLAMPHRAPNKMLNFGQNNHVYMLTQHFDRHQYSGGGNTVTIDIARDKGAGGRECNWDNVQANGSCDHTRPIVGGADTECWQNDHPNPWNPVCRNGANCWGNGDIMLNAESDGATDSTSTSSNDADCQSQAGEGGARNCCQGLGDNFGWYYDAGSAQNFASGDQHYHCNRKRPGYIPGMCAHMNLSPSHGSLAPVYGHEGPGHSTQGRDWSDFSLSLIDDVLQTWTSDEPKTFGPGCYASGGGGQPKSKGRRDDAPSWACPGQRAKPCKVWAQNLGRDARMGVQMCSEDPEMFGKIFGKQLCPRGRKLQRMGTSIFDTVSLNEQFCKEEACKAAHKQGEDDELTKHCPPAKCAVCEGKAPSPGCMPDCNHDEGYVCRADALRTWGDKTAETPVVTLTKVQETCTTFMEAGEWKQGGKCGGSGLQDATLEPSKFFSSVLEYTTGQYNDWYNGLSTKQMSHMQDAKTKFNNFAAKVFDKTPRETTNVYG